jgi:hypothetical protein
MSKFRVTQAYLSSNVAYFEVPAAHDWQGGEVVTVSGCTTSAFNISLTVTAAGLMAIPVASSSGAGTSLLWSGFFAPITNANIAVEVEPAAAAVVDLN